MSDFGRLIAREAGAGGGSGRRKRTRGPRRRPSFIAHPCTDWSDEHVKEHLRACQTGRGPDGEWDFDPDNEAEVWAWLWETMPRTRPDGTLDWGAWSSVIREVEVP